MATGSGRPVHVGRSAIANLHTQALKPYSESQAMAGVRAFLIDGTAFCYRAFYALPPLSAPDGRATHAVYGFAMMLQALRHKEHPDALAVAFDAGKPTFRHEAFEEYKRHRKPMPEELIAQLPLVKRLLEAHRIPVFVCEGYEGEDVLATIARQVKGDDVQTWLVTGDKDVLQLITPRLHVYNPHTATVLDAAAVETRYGLRPEQMLDLMALMGDETDNIPGVPGIGEKTAVALLQRFGSVEEMYRRLDEIESPARRKQLEASRAQVSQSRELARVRSDAPLSVVLPAIRMQEPDWAALRTLYRELQFTRLLHEVEAQAPVETDWHPATHPAGTEAEVRRLLDACAQTRHAPAVLCWPMQHRSSSLVAQQQVEGRGSKVEAPLPSTFDLPPSTSAVVPLAQDPPPPALLVAVAPSDAEAWLALVTTRQHPLVGWLEEAGSAKISHDAKQAMRRLSELGVELRGIVGDTMLAAHLLNPGLGATSLSGLVAESSGEWLGEYPGEAPRPTTMDAQQASWATFGRWACAAWRAHQRLLERVEAQGAGPLYRELELPLTEVLAAMERVGVAVDVPTLGRLRASMQAKLSTLAEEIERLAGMAFNLNSPKQLAQVLFERLQLPVVKRTKTGPSTDSGVLAELATRHPLPERVIQYRELSKLISTYVEALPRLVHPKTGRLHTTFNQAATATGRLSSSDPNLQNIPVKTELGRAIRKAFIAGVQEGVLVAADYSQIELRILAHRSGDEALREAFHRGADIHRATAALIYGCPEAEVQPEQRQAMKAVNFGVLYGMTPHGLSKELALSIEEAQAFIDAYFTRYPRVRDYLDSQIAQARRDGFVQTLLGRRRYLPEINSPDLMVRQAAERMALNAPIQGTAADLIKRAMVQLAGCLRAEALTARMVLQVHDELVFEAPRRELPRLVPLVRRIMEGALTLSVPLIVTLKAGPNWLELAPVSE